MPDHETQPGPGSVAVMLLFWAAAFIAWRAVVGRWPAAQVHLARWYGGVVCALVTASVFGCLAAGPPGRAHLIAWGLAGAALTLACSRLDHWPAHRPMALNLGLLAATFSAGMLLGELVTSTQYQIPILFAGAVDAALRTWSSPWSFPADPGDAYLALRFPAPGASQLTPVFLPGELLFLAIFLRAVERLGIGPSQFTVASAASVTLFCLSSGSASLAAVRCPLMAGAFMAVQWCDSRLRKHATPPQAAFASAWPGPVAFGLAFAGLMAALAWANSGACQFARH